MIEFFLNRSIRVKIISSVVFASVLVTLVATTALTIMMQGRQKDALKNELRLISEITASSINLGLEFSDKSAVDEALDAVKEKVDYVVVLDGNNENFTSYYKRDSDEGQIGIAPDYSEFEDYGLLNKKSPVENLQGTQLGYIQIGMDTSEIASSLVDGVVTALIVILLSVLLGFGISVVTTRIITTPLFKILERMRDIAEGEGDLTKRIDMDYQDEIGQLAQTFNVFVAKLNDLISRVAKASMQIRVSVQSISRSTEEVARAAVMQSEQTTLVATSSEEMSVNIMSNTANTNDAVVLSQNASESAQTGREVVDGTISAVNTIAAAVADSAKTISELEKSSSQITNIIEVINDITDQVNILSLNASIEAVSAGEYGKGFAVVADEIKNLADRTNKSTAEISMMIVQIQTTTNLVIKFMENISKEIENGIDLSKKTDASLNQILQLNNQAMEMITNISVSSKQQSQTAEEISKSIESIAGITRDTTSKIKNIDSISETLVTHTNTLKELVEMFKLKDNGGT